MNNTLYKISVDCKMLFVNRLRVILTIMGMSVSMIIMIFMIEMLNSYNLYNLKAIEYMDVNATMITDYTEIDMSDVWKKLVDNQVPFSFVTFKVSDDIGAIRNYKSSGKVSCNFRLIGASDHFENSYVFFEQDGRSMFCKAKALSYDQNQAQQTTQCIIEKSTALLLFGEQNAVGKKIQLVINDVCYEFEIGKIIEDRPSTVSQSLKINASTRFNRDVIAECDVFVPLSWYCNYYNDYEYNKTSIVVFSDMSNQELVNAIVENGKYNSKTIENTNYENTLQNLSETNSVFEVLINIMMGIIFVVSSLVVMNTLLFSIKDRVREIGIKKAIGASSKNIISQIIFEGFIYSMIAYSVAISISIILFCGLDLLLLMVMGIDFIMYIHINTVVVMLFAAVLEGFVFSLIPAIYATRIDTLEAISFS